MQHFYQLLPRVPYFGTTSRTYGTVQTVLADVVALQLSQVRFLHCEGDGSTARTHRSECSICSIVIHPAVERRRGGHLPGRLGSAL